MFSLECRFTATTSRTLSTISRWAETKAAALPVIQPFRDGTQSQGLAPPTSRCCLLNGFCYSGRIHLVFLGVIGLIVTNLLDEINLSYVRIYLVAALYFSPHTSNQPIQNKFSCATYVYTDTTLSSPILHFPALRLKKPASTASP